MKIKLLAPLSLLTLLLLLWLRPDADLLVHQTQASSEAELPLKQNSSINNTVQVTEYSEITEVNLVDPLLSELSVIEATTSSPSNLTEFIEVGSEFHQILLEQLYSENTPEQVQKEPLVIVDDTGYLPYVTEVGIEFYVLNNEVLRQITKEPNSYRFQLDLLESEIEQQQEVATDYEYVIHQLIEKLDSSYIQLMSLACRGKVCVSQLAHPNNGEKAVRDFYQLIKRNRRTCECKGVFLPYQDYTESTFRFVFD